MPNKTHQIRATYDDKTIRVYQAYSDAIADAALEHGTFRSPPFKMERMTWIKPSFLWMMYRSGWGEKDANQNRILAIDISREGFEWALSNSVLSHEAKNYKDRDEWLRIKKSTPVRIQWDPERDFHLQPLEHRAIQIGLCNEAVTLYVNEWIQRITDVTSLAENIRSLVHEENLEAAKSHAPIETKYPLNDALFERITPR
ncbi:DUF4291 domain-containing protein [Saccharospirillum sp. HFRX-1]|uniref:DUF4291 domain-containing protein n=1 Tax=unclassified Saccharospirillum TaxID=2633430 RepID=UPI003720E306